MVTIKLMGGLGNQLFSVFTMLSLAFQYGLKPFFVSKTSSKEYKERLTIKFENLSNVAYHINCGKLTTFLQKKFYTYLIIRQY